MRTIEDIMASRLQAGKVDTNRIFNHHLIADFQREYEDVTHEMLRRSLPKLNQYIKEQEQCGRCEGLETCPNLITGHCSQLVGYEGHIDLQLRKCNRLEAYEEAEKRRRLLKSHKVPKDVLIATFQTMDFDPQRAPVIQQIMQYCDGFNNGDVPRNGLYLHGSFGVGKSHMAAATANHLTTMGVDSFMVYVPDFAQEIYASFRNNTTSDLIGAVKQVKVLILDDIGAENLNAYFRDDVLGNILQHRMSEHFPTIYTSNLSMNELERHMSYTAKGGEEKTKAARIMERIRHFANSLEIKGRNRRVEAV